jgi:hypothetical protein
MAEVGLSARTHHQEGALLERWRAQFWKALEAIIHLVRPA